MARHATGGEDDSTEKSSVLPGSDEPARVRTTQVDDFWADVRIQPIEIALPSGVGYTLRAYRMSDELPDGRGAVFAADEDEGSADIVTRVDEGDVGPARTVRRGDERAILEDEDLDEEDLAAEDADDDVEDEEEPPVEEVPVFMAHRGKLLLFRSPEGLVAYAKSDAPHDLTMLEEWPRTAERLTAAHVVPTEEDSYELDLVVDNLRGGHDAWHPELLIAAGEIARDLAYALRLTPVMTSLAPGSPLDDLDEGLRRSAEGGMGGFVARRRLRKVGAQQAALAWRTIVGKISAAVDWRD